MIRLATTLTVLFALVACATTSEIPPGLRIGEPIQDRPIQTLAAVQAEPEAHFDQTLLVEAEVKAVCQKMGCWMQVVDQDGATSLVRWEEGCGGKYVFPKDAAGERILIQGSFYPKKLDPADAEHLKEEADREISFPAKGYEFNASAVVMLDRAK